MMRQKIFVFLLLMIVPLIMIVMMAASVMVKKDVKMVNVLLVKALATHAIFAVKILMNAGI